MESPKAANHPDDAKFIARYWLASLPDMKIRTHPHNDNNVGDEADDSQNFKSMIPRKNPNLFTLCSGVDFRCDGNKGKTDIDGDHISDNSDLSEDEVPIGTERHDYKSPAPRPIGSVLSRDISLDLMRFRGSAPITPKHISSQGEQSPRRRASQAGGQRVLLPAIVLKSAPVSTMVEADATSLPHQMSLRSVDQGENLGIDKTAETVKPEIRLMGLGMRAWREVHDGSMQQKLRIMDQYLACCAFLKRSPFLKAQLRRFLLRPSSNRFDLAGCGTTSKDITACFSALSGRGCELRADRVTSVQEVRASLGDQCLAAMDLSSNALASEGMAAVTTSLVHACFFQQASAALTELDLARNGLGVAGATWVATMVAAPSCTLICLGLSANMLSDAGCAAVLRGLMCNTTLLRLDLTDNGAAQAAGSAMGSLLEKTSTLEDVSLAYNHLRGTGARRIGQGLSCNKSLHKLDLRWNGFGDEDVLSDLARALPVANLEELNLAHNRIKLKGSSILASAIELGSPLRQLVLDGNLIGQIGARVVFRAVQSAADAAGDDAFPLSVSTLNCGTHIVDRAAFDPSETAGGYDLDLADSYNRSVFSKLIRVAMSGRGSFAPIKARSEFTGRLQIGVEVKICHNNSIDPTDWTLTTASGVNLPLVEATDPSGQSIPLARDWSRRLGRKEEGFSCVLQFSFNNLRRRATIVDRMSHRDISTLQTCFEDPHATADKCIEVIDTVFGSDVFISLEQIDHLLSLLTDDEPGRNAELGRVRVALISRCFHKLIESGQSGALIDKLMNIEERMQLEKALGAASFEFTPNNPTGYHKLDLSDPAQREICMRLVEMRNDLEDREMQLRSFYAERRTGGRRETSEDSPEMERMWRSSRFEGASFIFRADWKVPFSGILEVDFVQTTKPEVDERPRTAHAGDLDPFDEVLNRLQDPEASDRDKILALRQHSNKHLFTCKQISTALEHITDSDFRAEVFVIAYSRTRDWHGLTTVLLTLSMAETHTLHRRLGLVNLFDDVMAVGFYELDLSRTAERFLMQELLHLAAVEPGENMQEGIYQGIDYTVPAGWLKDVPRTGVISFYYCREQEVIEKIFVKGSWEGPPSPFSVRENGKLFGSSSWCSFTPKWLRPFCVRTPAAGPVPCPQPAGGAWVREHKLRRIRNKMSAKFNDPKKMFEEMDRDGGGTLVRKELAMGLFELGIWLCPSELQALQDTLDKDGGGDIDLDEFKLYWNTYVFD